MFKRLTKEERLLIAEKENEELKGKLLTAEANMDYLSMMSGIDMPAGDSSEEALNQEEGEDNE